MKGIKSEMPQWAREHIFEVKHTRASTLSLCNCGLTILPNEILELDWLEELRLDGNLLRELPKELELFSSLSRINIIDNPIENIPDIDGLVVDSEQMVKLAVPKSRIVGLRFCGHNCASIPDYFNESCCDIPNLKEIYLKDCSLRTWPGYLFRIQKLEILSINKCNITEIPNEIITLKSLRVLDLTFNSIASIPDFLCKMRHLTKVNLEGNFITASENIEKSLPCFECLHNGKWVAKLKRKQTLGSDYSQLQKQQLKSTQRHHIETLSSEPTISPKLRSEIYISYAWEKERAEPLVEELIAAMKLYGIHVIRDSEQLVPGDQISNFMAQLSDGRCILIVLSESYLRSSYCMTELYSIWINARQRGNEFLKRIVPLVQSDAGINTIQGRLNHAIYWKNRYEELDLLLRKHGADLLGPRDAKLYKTIGDYYRHVGEILEYANDILFPQDKATISANNFNVVREMIERALHY